MTDHNYIRQREELDELKISSLLRLVENLSTQVKESAEKYIPADAWRKEIGRHHSIPTMCDRIIAACGSLRKALGAEEGVKLMASSSRTYRERLVRVTVDAYELEATDG